MPPSTRANASSIDEVEKSIASSRTLSSESKNLLKFLIDAMKSMLNERDNELSEMINKLETERAENFQKLNSLQEELETYKTENVNLSSQLTKMNNAHDDLEAYGRRESLVFSGDKIKVYRPDENCVTIAQHMIKSELKIPIDPLISTAHRMGRPPASGSNRPDKRPIIVKFVKRDDKFQILKAARNKSTRVPGLYVNESLTPTRAKILQVLRKCKSISNGLVKGTTTNNGKVIAIHKSSATAPDGEAVMRTEINTRELLSDFCNNFLKKPLESFLDAEGRKIFA